MHGMGTGIRHDFWERKAFNRRACAHDRQQNRMQRLLKVRGLIDAVIDGPVARRQHNGE